MSARVQPTSPCVDVLMSLSSCSLVLCPMDPMDVRRVGAAMEALYMCSGGHE